MRAILAQPVLWAPAIARAEPRAIRGRARLSAKQIRRAFLMRLEKASIAAQGETSPHQLPLSLRNIPGLWHEVPNRGEHGATIFIRRQQCLPPKRYFVSQGVWGSKLPQERHGFCCSAGVCHEGVVHFTRRRVVYVGTRVDFVGCFGGGGGLRFPLPLQL